MNRFHFFSCPAFLLLLVMAGMAAAGSAANTTITATTLAAATTTTPGTTGGSIAFETDPAGAMVWLDGTEIATSPITYFSEKTGTLDVRISKKGFEDYTGNVTVIDGERVNFFALLTPVPRDIPEVYIPVATLTTAPTIRRTPMTVPTPWPTSVPQSPADPAVVIGAAALGTSFLAIRRR
jgi:hypothetical protein